MTRNFITYDDHLFKINLGENKLYLLGHALAYYPLDRGKIKP